MDYYENVVIEYLRADRSLFVNTECCIQINEGSNPDTSGPHWYCDAVTVDFRNSEIYLCEISFANQLSSLTNRLNGWNEHWKEVCLALVRDCNVPSNWPVRPWVFTPEDLVPKLISKIKKLPPNSEMPPPKITTLEMVQPWKYQSWSRLGELEKPDAVPENIR